MLKKIVGFTMIGAVFLSMLVVGTLEMGWGFPVSILGLIVYMFIAVYFLASGE